MSNTAEFIDCAGFALRLPDGRRTRVYVCPEAAWRAVGRGEVFTDLEYKRGQFWATPGNPTPGYTSVTHRLAPRRRAA